MKKENKIQFKYALKYAAITYILILVIQLIFGIINTLFSKTLLVIGLVGVLANISSIIAFVYFCHKAIDRIYKEHKIFNHSFGYWILLFVILISGTINTLIIILSKESISLSIIADAYLGQGIGIGLLVAPIFISTHYQIKHHAIENVKPIKPIKFFKLDFSIFILSLVLVIIFTIAFLSINPFIPAFQNDSGGNLVAISLAVGVISAILLSYFMSCLLFFIYEKIKIRNKK